MVVACVRRAHVGTQVYVNGSCLFRVGFALGFMLTFFSIIANLQRIDEIARFMFVAFLIASL